MLTTVRKLRKTGGSLSVAIPPDWLSTHGLAAGDELELRYTSREVHVRPREETEEAS